MDNLTNWTGGMNVTTPIPGQNCVSNLSASSILDKLLITTPSLVSINQELKWIFLLHTYGFACLFFVLAFYTFLSILHLRSLISSRPFMTTINMFLCILGASRATCLFIDPYNLKDIMPKIIGSVIWDIGFPCVTSAFSLIQLAFLQLTQLKFGPEKLQKESCLSLVITAHFVFVIASDIALTSHNCNMVKYVVQTLFLIWSILLYLIFLYAGYKIIHLLQTVPSSMLMRDNSNIHHKGIMQLAMLAPYNNLASSVAAALVPTLLNSKVKDVEEAEPATFTNDSNKTSTDGLIKVTKKEQIQRDFNKSPCKSTSQDEKVVPVSTVPEVYVRPPTPTPSTINEPIITVTSPSRRSSVASRRSSDASKSSRRNSECSVRFINEEDGFATSGYRRNSDFSPKHSPEINRRRSPDRMSRRYSENVTPIGSVRDLRRCSDFSHEKNRSSQFAAKLKRNSDFGNRTPRRMLPTNEHSKLPKVMDLSPSGSRRNSDISGFTSRIELRRNSDISFRDNSKLGQMKLLDLNRRSSDISIRTLSRSPTHGRSIVPEKMEIQEKSESDSDQPDCSEKAALMTEKNKDKDNDDGKSRKKNLSWKNEKEKEKEDIEDITVETNLLSETTKPEGKIASSDFTLHSILNHIAYVNRTKSDTPLHILEANTAAIRRSQIRKVLNITCATAILGIILCITDVARIFGPYGLLAESVTYGTRAIITQYPRPWPWFMYQTVCRGIELIMGWAMASITKQPSVHPRHQYLSGYPNCNIHVKRGNNPYL
ncbi:uncharacterized protein LOC114875792 isoform X1 [Osmia bicornis bicornis]|uniref:uncharacterized protein LOC114875792 isoform X1 n=2 Tax=Osmia bicornis bicornis TaxID=1437191 RepID=UPI001EAF1869|nr:uncharacterized protein LOC114875792 isoform X1 [Osmia bicornis bicornis]XP_046146065.1 uncharacterized protein LOC114875792 isoform X1 [Osmia bicornis bicornis]XP_046146066.1 uncharacterized protein LOC114875792 isoform X1 [Osmia bicornis bicornis]XP_046146067.1 uncharacterized protein LOC114875792 isoform X1 [Osmia bicornis bicornis]